MTAANTTLKLRNREVVEPDKPLVGTTWALDTIISGDTASSVPAGVKKATIELPTDTRIEVYDGCNRTSGAVEVDGASLRVVDLPAPVRGNCRPGSAIDYDKVLTGRVAVQIDGERLTLTSAAGDGYGFHAA